MVLRLDVTTIGGEVFVVDARHHWSVLDVKAAIHCLREVPPAKQKLINSDGDTLVDDRPLCDFCAPAAEGGAVELNLVELAKTQEEIDHLERWFATTPDWWQRSTAEVWGKEDLCQLRRDLNADGEPCVLHANMPRRCNCSLDNRQAVEVALAEVVHELPILVTSREVLAALERRPFRLRAVRNDKDCVELFVESAGPKLLPRKAAYEAVMTAIEQEPRLVLQRADNTLVEAAAGRHPGIYNLLGADQQSTCILYTALEIDAELREEFLATAGKKEIRAWEWHRQESKRPSIITAGGKRVDFE